MARSRRFRALVCKLGGRGDSVSVIDQRIAKSDPQLRIARIALDRILQNPDRILAFTAARERFRHAQPELRRGEVAEEGMPRLRKRDEVPAFEPLRGRCGQFGAALERVAGRAEQQSGRAGSECRTTNAQQPKRRNAQCDEEKEDDPAHQRTLVRTRRRISHPPTSSRASGASHSGQAESSAVGL